MATRHSTRKRPSGRADRPRPPIPSAPPVPPPAKSGAAWKRMARSVARTDNKPDLDEILGHFCEALAIAETAYEALKALQEKDGKWIGAAVLTLDHGLQELRHAYTELDLAIMRLRPEGAA